MREITGAAPGAQPFLDLPDSGPQVGERRCQHAVGGRSRRSVQQRAHPAPFSPVQDPARSTGPPACIRSPSRRAALRGRTVDVRSRSWPARVASVSPRTTRSPIYLRVGPRAADLPSAFRRRPPRPARPGPGNRPDRPGGRGSPRPGRAAPRRCGPASTPSSRPGPALPAMAPAIQRPAVPPPTDGRGRVPPTTVGSPAGPAAGRSGPAPHRRAGPGGRTRGRRRGPRSTPAPSRRPAGRPWTTAAGRAADPLPPVLLAEHRHGRLGRLPGLTDQADRQQQVAAVHQQ